MLASRGIARRHQNSRKGDAEKRCPRYLKWVRGCRCALYGKKGHSCEGRIEAAHVDYAGDKGVGTKVADRYVVPLCSAAHRQQHSMGWTNFESIWRYAALPHANRLWDHWSNREAAGRDWHRQQAELAAAVGE